MGCDIHGWVEVNTGIKWVAVNKLKSRERNYSRFAALAGVREKQSESSAEPMGMPADVSDTAQYDIEQWGVDGHSHSYMPLVDAAEIFLTTEYNPNGFARKYPLSEFFDFEQDNADKARLVFWFDS